MIRSFHYAVCAKLYFSSETKGIDPLRLQKVGRQVVQTDHRCIFGCLYAYNG